MEILRLWGLEKLSLIYIRKRNLKELDLRIYAGGGGDTVGPLRPIHLPGKRFFRNWVTLRWKWGRCAILLKV